MLMNLHQVVCVRCCALLGLFLALMQVFGFEALAGDPEATLTFLKGHDVQLKWDSEGYITDLQLREQSPTRQFLESLPTLSRLRSLVLAGTATTDDSLGLIAHLDGLRNIDLRNCPVSNAGLAQLTGMKSLAAIRLSGATGQTTVDDDGMVSLAAISSLQTVMLDGLWVSEGGLEHLVVLEGLRELTLAQTLVGDEALPVIARMERLRRLRLAKTSITAEGLRAIASLSQLRDLDISECASVDDAALEPVGRLSQLERLNLWRVPVSDDGIRHLKHLQKMKWLNLDNTMLTDSGLGVIAGMPALATLHIGSTAVSNAGIKHLVELSNLREVFLARTAVDSSGVTALRTALPEATVVDTAAE